MLRDVCDRCLAVNTTGKNFARLLINLTETDDKVWAKTDDKASIETIMSICEECRPTVEGIVVNRIMLTSTPDDVKIGTLFRNDPPSTEGTWNEDDPTDPVQP